MSYQPNIPLATDAISQSQVDIETNFQQLNIGFAVDHVAYDLANAGTHKVINFITTPIPAAPSPSGTNSGLYPAADALDASTWTQLFFKTANQTHQLTSNFNTAAASGSFMLPGGLFALWTFQLADTDPVSPGVWANTHTVNFNPIDNFVYTGPQTQGFPNNCFFVGTQLCAGDTATKTCNVKSGSTTKERFVIKLSSTSVEGIYYFAIGN